MGSNYCGACLREKINNQVLSEGWPFFYTFIFWLPLFNVEVELTILPIWLVNFCALIGEHQSQSYENWGPQDGRLKQLDDYATCTANIVKYHGLFDKDGQIISWGNEWMRIKTQVNVSWLSFSYFCRFIEPTILLDPPLDAEIMTEEIFGPFLPIITVRYLLPCTASRQFPCIKRALGQLQCLTIFFISWFPLLFQLKKIEDSIEFINSKPQALSLYVFTKDKTFQNQVIAKTSSGSVTVNDTIIQVHSLSSLFYLIPQCFVSVILT